MTAINVLLQRDRAWLVTDAAWYDLDGVVQHFGPKSQAVPHWPGAIATRGPGLANATIAAEAGLIFADLDAFADGAPDFLEGWCRRNADSLDAFFEQRHVEVVAVGWSKSRGRARAFIVSTKDEATIAAAQGIEVGEDHASRPFELFEIETGYMRPTVSPDQLRAVGVDPEMDFDACDVLGGVGSRVIVAQRELREPILLGGDRVCFVGGYVMITHVDRHNVIAHKGGAFPDVVGRRIEARPDDIFWPHEAEPIPALPAGPPSGVTRQQRRAWEAQQRKRGGGSVRLVR